MKSRLAFYVTSGTAIAIVAGIWVWNVRSVVQSGVAGARDVLSTVATTASDVKAQSAPNQEAIDAVKQGLHQVIQSAADDQKQKQATVDAVAGLMSETLKSNQ